MSVLDDRYEAATSDVPGDPRFPAYTRAPTDAGAAAPASPFVHLITLRGDDAVLVRFWCEDEPRGAELRVDFEPLVAALPWRGGPVRATSALVAKMIVGTFFETFVDGWYRAGGVRTLRLRDLRDGTVVVHDHTRKLDADRDLRDLLAPAG